MNDGLAAVQDSVKGLETSVSGIISEAKTMAGVQTEHQGEASGLQGKIDTAILVRNKITAQETDVKAATKKAQERKQKSMEMMGKIAEIVNESLERKREAENAVQAQAVSRVGSFVERAEKAAKSAEENAALLEGEERKTVAATAVQAAQKAAEEAKACVPTEEFDANAEKTAKAAEAAANSVIAEVRAEALQDVARLREIKKRVETNFKSIQSSIGVLSEVLNGFFRHGDEGNESKIIHGMLNAATAISNTCSESLENVSETLDVAEVTLKSLHAEKLNLSQHKKAISKAVAIVENSVRKTDEMKQAVDENAAYSMKVARDLHVEAKAAYLEKRKLNYFAQNKEQEDNLVSPLVSAEQEIAAQMRSKLEGAVALSREMLKKMKGSSEQLKNFADSVEDVYRKGEFEKIQETYAAACSVNKKNKKQYKLIMAAIAIEKASTMLLTKAEIFELVHKQLRGELSLENAKKAISEQESKIKGLTAVVAELLQLKEEARNVSFNALLNDEEPTLLIKIEGVRLYGPEFSELLSDLQHLESDIAFYQESLKPFDAQKKIEIDSALKMDGLFEAAAENEMFKKTRLYDLLESIVFCIKENSDSQKNDLIGLLSVVKEAIVGGNKAESNQGIETLSFNGILIKELLTLRAHLQKENQQNGHAELLGFIDKALLDEGAEKNAFKPDLDFAAALLHKVQVLKKSHPENAQVEGWNKMAKTVLAMFFYDAKSEEIKAAQEQVNGFKVDAPENLKGHLDEVNTLLLKLTSLSVGKIDNKAIRNSQEGRVEIVLLEEIYPKIKALGNILSVQKQEDNQSKRIMELEKYIEGLDPKIMLHVKEELTALISKSKTELTGIAEGKISLDKVEEVMQKINAVLEVAEQRKQEAEKNGVNAEKHAEQRSKGARTITPIVGNSDKPRNPAESLDALEDEALDASNAH